MGTLSSHTNKNKEVDGNTFGWEEKKYLLIMKAALSSIIHLSFLGTIFFFTQNIKNLIFFISISNRLAVSTGLLDPIDEFTQNMSREKNLNIP